MIRAILKLVKILKHVFKYLPLYLMAWGVLKKMGKKLFSGNKDAKPATQAENEASGESKKKNETGANEKLVFKVPQEIRGVSLKPEECALLDSGKALFIANMNGENGEKFSSYVKMNKKDGKLEYYNENPDKATQTMVRYSIPQTGIENQKQANLKKIKI
jgi:hypothetical protein